ncbi:MAG: InlB B-repeat-containing protein, partial [Clostridia bacterium]|nr:InlB B-repeat-containing protein [Clostridia bacterium]
MKKILLVLLAVCLIVGLAACNDNTEVYSITFNTLGGGENIEVVLDGSTELVFPDDPEKQGYDFKGWFYDKDVWEQPVSLAIIKQTGIAQNTEIYAKWEEKPPVVIEEPDPDVNFNTYGGTEVQGLTGVEQITQAPQTSKTGYSFLGWFLSLDDTQPVVFPYTPQQDTTLHAKWHLVNYSVTYNLDGGDASNPESYNIESGTVTLAPATRTGYTFQGWYSDSAFVTPVTEFSSEATGNLHFFAKWEINTYKLKYYLDGDIYTVEEEPVELSFKYGAHITDTIGMLIKEGNSFSGWKLNDGSEIPAVMPATDLNVYGRF